MKKFFKILLITVGSIIGLIVIILAVTILWISVSGNQKAKKNMALAGPEVQTITIDTEPKDVYFTKGMLAHNIICYECAGKL